MHFPLDNSVCRVETACPLVLRDNLDAVLLSTNEMHFSLDDSVKESRQLARSHKLRKIFFHSYHVDGIGHDCFLSLTFSPHGYDCLLLPGKFHTKENRGRKKDSSGLWIKSRQSFNNQNGKQMILLSLEKGRTTSLNVTRTVKDVVWRHRFLMRGMMEFFIAEYSIMLENEGMMLRTIS